LVCTSTIDILVCCVDVMTAKGQLMAITHHGINHQDTCAFMRCYFEERCCINGRSSVTCRSGPLRGVTENILMGQLPVLGTGELGMKFQVFWDMTLCYCTWTFWRTVGPLFSMANTWRRRAFRLQWPTPESVGPSSSMTNTWRRRAFVFNDQHLKV
jgi:hypothetical protein